MYSGIDISKHNGTIDFAKVKKAGVQFVMVRAGYGKEVSQKDNKFEVNYKGCKTNNIPCGVYWYSYATTITDAEREANACLSIIKGKQFEYPVVFDIEDKTQAKLGQTLISNIVKAFCNKIEKAGYWATMYTYKAFATNISDEIKSRYDMWIAQVSSKCTYTSAYGMWQHSFTGRVNGINGDVDLDIAYKDYPTLIKSKGLNGFEKVVDNSTNLDQTSENISKYDINGDGKITSEDALEVLQNIVGLK